MRQLVPQRNPANQQRMSSMFEWVCNLLNHVRLMFELPAWSALAWEFLFTYMPNWFFL